MDQMPSFLWAFAVVGGPIALGLALYYGVKHSHRRDQMMRENPGGPAGAPRFRR
jgi:hypothetical protein